MQQPRLAHVESLGSESASDECQLHEAALLRQDTQLSTGDDTGSRPNSDSAGRLSQFGCEADINATGDTFDGYEDLLEAGMEEWNMDFVVARGSSLATEADTDWLPSKGDVASWTHGRESETSTAGCSRVSSCSSRCSVCGCDSVQPLSLLDTHSLAIQTPRNCCSSILRTSLMALPTDGTSSLSVCLRDEHEVFKAQQQQLQEEDEEEEEQSTNAFWPSLTNISSLMNFTSNPDQ
mmetsp:Transcript_106645/g.206628  ORF Transcript_106645/g.206628 Transcript_106645/m.206628 type:complete len:236 (+) Transcript_106645:59-766(+)